MKTNTNKKLYNEILDICINNNFILLSQEEDIINNSSIVSFLCKDHGIQKKTVKNFKSRSTCVLCSKEIRSKKMWETRRKKENYKQKYYENALSICKENGYKLISDMSYFNDQRSYIEYECPQHGIKRIRYDNFANGKRCPDCHSDKMHYKYMLPKNEVVKRIEKNGAKILNPDEYINQDTKSLQILCPRCKTNVFVTSLKHFQQHGGQLCSECFKKESIGELKIRQWIEKNNIEYEYQKKYSDCKDKNPLPFDFYLPSYNLIIEFDGDQHSRDTHFFNHIDNRFNNSIYSYIQYHDKIKNDYCKSNNINLLRIPYKDLNNIEQILNETITNI